MGPSTDRSSEVDVSVAVSPYFENEIELDEVGVWVDFDFGPICESPIGTT